MNRQLRSTVAAAMLLVPMAAALVAEPAAAQQRATVAQPAIHQMSFNSDAGLSPGATLRVQVSGTPGASRGTLTLGDSGVTIRLRPAGRGTYAGSYVVRRADRIDPTELLTARLTYGKNTYSRQFNFPASFQALAMGNAPATAPRVEIERFVMRASGPIEPGRELRFRMRGAAGGDAWLDIPGVIRGIDMAEIRPGVYEGRYTVRRRDNPEAFRTAVGNLKLGEQRVTARVDLDASEEDWRAVRDDRRGERHAGPLPLDVTSHTDNMAVDANGNFVLRGRTAPHATVRVQVDSVANVIGMFGVSQPVADATVQADRNGRFSVQISPQSVLPIPGTRYDVRVTATSGTETAEERITLTQRG